MLCSCALLHSARHLDAVQNARTILAHAYVQQWTRALLTCAAYRDAWIVVGLGGQYIVT